MPGSSAEIACFHTFYKAHIAQIEICLKTVSTTPFTDARATLTEAIQHSLLAGGKRIRPLLSLAVHQLFSQDNGSMIYFACCIELIHTYTLIHDDLPAMDNDDMRRGKPTCHKQFGDDMAILAGDTLNTLAFEVLADKLTDYNPQRVLYVIKKLAQHIGIDGVVGGQVLDIKAPQAAQTLAHLELLHHKKTGALLYCAIVLPAYLNGASTAICSQLATVAHHLGLLFQIVDDILDVTGNVTQLGKSPGKDALLHKLTYPGLLGLEGAYQHAAAVQKEAESVLDGLKETAGLDTAVLTAMVHYIAQRTH